MRSKSLMAFAVFVLLFAVTNPVNATGLEIRGGVVTDPTGTVVWNAQNFAGFYYDLAKNISSEELTILSITNGTIPEDKLVYSTKRVPAEFKVFEKEHKTIGGASTYSVVGWRGEKWIAVNNKANKLAKLILDMDGTEKKTLTPDEKWDLGSGYELSIVAIDAKATPRQAWLTFKKDGKTVDDVVVQQQTVYTNQATILGDADSLRFTVYVDSIFSGTTKDMIQLKYGWLIDENSLKEIKSSDTFGVFEVTSAGADSVVLTNKNSISLTRDSEITLLDTLKFKVANSPEVRFYPKIDIGSVPVVASPTPVQTVVSTSTSTPVPSTPVPTAPAPTNAVVSIPAVPAPATTIVTAEQNNGTPGFEALFAIVGLLVVAYIVLRKKK